MQTLISDLLHIYLAICVFRPQLARRYGNVYSLFLGPQKVVVVNGLQALKEAFITRAADFSGRPHGLLLNDATQRKGTAAASYAVTAGRAAGGQDS